MGDAPLVLIEELQTPVEDLWALWTDPEEVTRWLAGSASIDLRVGGSYLLSGHLLSHALSDPVGGPIVGLEEEYVLKVAWRLPSSLGTALHELTPPGTLVVLFQPLGPNRTRLRLEQDGFGSGPEGEAALQWQKQVWADVLAHLKQKSG